MAVKVILLFMVGTVVAGKLNFDLPTRDYKTTPLGKAVDQASVKLLKEVIANSNGKNVVSSPLGVLFLLAQYSTGTDGALRDDLIHYLGGSSSKYTELTESYHKLKKQLDTLISSPLSLANKMYVANGNKVSSSFLEQAKKYNSAVEEIDFHNNAEVVESVNKWAEKQTQGHITKAVTNNDISPDAALAMFNVIFFKGHWHVPFKAEDTEEKEFYVTKDRTVKKPMMKLSESLFIHDSSTLNARLVELPYKESGFRMVIILPNEIDGLPSLVEKVAQNGILDDINQLLPAGNTVDLLLPKFNIESDLDLNTLLPKIGLTKLFQQPANGVVEGSSVVVSKAIQKAFIKVDEEGATAGAFTGFVAVPISFPVRPRPSIKFHVDHPFLYTILYQDTIAFIGVYKD